MLSLNKKYIFGIVLLLGVILISLIYLVSALSQGPKIPGTVVDATGIGTVTWVNPNNAKTSDNVYATAVLLDASPSARTTHYLKATNYGFTIPAGATITGIVVSIDRHADFDVKDTAVRIVKSDGTIGTTNKGATTTFWPASDAIATYGSSSDLWGETWAYSDINDVDFGVVLVANNPGTDVDDAKAYVDYMFITVYYTTDTCTCPAINTNWVINMADSCNIITTCNLGTGNISWTGTGTTTFNAVINATKMAAPGANQKLNIGSNARVYLG